MDKETLSNYGWIVICVLVLAVMIALASPFGQYVASAVENTTQGLFDVEQGALSAAGIDIADQKFEKPTTEITSISGGYYDLNGNLKEHNTICHTDFIPVEYGKTYRAILPIGTPGAVLFDEQKEFVSYIGGNSQSVAEQYITITNPDVKFISINHNANDAPAIYLIEVEESEIKTPSGMITFLGDSITSGHATAPNTKPQSSGFAYSNLLSRDLNMKKQILAVSGYKISGNSPAITDQSAKISDDADIICIMGGINDFMSAPAQIGTINDTTVDTFYGALNVLLKSVTEKCSDKQIVFLTPLNSTRATNNNPYTNKSLPEYIAVIKEVLAKYPQIKVIDTYTWSLDNLDPSDTSLFGDGLHPTTKGHAILNEFVKSEFQRLGIK